jgi:exocyst complex component 3
MGIAVGRGNSEWGTPGRKTIIIPNPVHLPPLFHLAALAMAAPTTSAAQAIGEYLQSPDDLMKIPAFRKKLEKEKASIDIRLKSGVKEQLSVTSESLRKLFSTRDNVQAIRDEMVVIDRTCSDPQNMVSTFDQISRVGHL